MKSIAWTTLPNGYIISTICRGDKLKAIDRMIATVTNLVAGDDGRSNLGQQGDYETMVFPVSGDDIDYNEIDFARYASLAEAVEGHRSLVLKWREMPAGLDRSEHILRREVN